MATTTNYGWTTPDNTALVKDGASAIRTLGSSVDTSLKSLSPGTTAGDVDYYTSSTAKARLAIGSTGQVLTVAAGVPSWATSSSGGMTLLSTTTLTGATVTISCISGSYTNLFAVIYGVTNATAAGAFRCSPNGTSNITDSTFLQASTTLGNQTNNYLNLFLGSGATTYLVNTNANNSITLQINNYASTTSYKNFFTSGAGITGGSTPDGEARFSTGFIKTNSAISSLQFLNSGGNLLTGTVLLYGVK